MTFARCALADTACGLLHCRHLNERLEFGMESVSQLAAVFINNNGTIIPCRTAIIDLGLSDVDPGMVPDGAKCGHNKMCLKQKCVDIEWVREMIAHKESSVCPSNCSGHGVCNSEGHCHCDAGFAPPLCSLPGPGGSFDSGPATDPSVQRNFMVAMYIIFLGIIPSILIILFLIYYSRHNVLLWWKKPRKSYVPNFCTGNNARTFFANIRAHSVTSSMRRLISFKRDSTKTHDINEQNKSETDGLNAKYDIILKGKKPLKKFDRKINKDDIQIADGTVTKPKPPPKPVVKKNNSNVVIVKAGLTSTTNEMVANTAQRSRMHSIHAGENHYANVKVHIKK